MHSCEVASLIQKLNECDNFDTYKNIIDNDIKKIANDLNIGKIDLELNIPLSLYDNTLFEKIYNLYYTNFDNNPTYISFKLEYNGYLRIHIYPKSSYSWTKEEDSCIHIIGNLILSSFNRLRYKNLVNEALLRDNLTNSYNIGGAIRMLSNKDLSFYNCMFFNIKNFKFVNKTLGYNNSNKVLIKFCRIIENHILKDEYLARAGGDNFVLFVKKENTQDTFSLLNSIKIKDIYDGHEHEFNLTCKIGIYVAKENDIVSTCVEKASIALSIAKNIKKADIIFYDKEVDKKISFEKNIISSFPQAINNKEFKVYYQPKVNAVNKTIEGAEALVRWSKDGQIIPPGKFIPVLEKENYICDLDFYILNEVCKDIKSWIKNNIQPVCVSINFSKKNLNNNNLANKILNIINSYEVPHEYIEIEITESVDFLNTDKIHEFINTLKSNGIHVSLDDFGSGYSSLGILMNIHFDVIKLDKSLIDNINNKESHNEIIVNIINLIKLFNVNIVAEGVEDKNQVQFLVDNGCNLIQGYVFDKPLPHDEFEARLKTKYY